MTKLRKNNRKINKNEKSGSNQALIRREKNKSDIPHPNPQIPLLKDTL